MRTGADLHDPIERQYKNLSVADLSGPVGVDDGVHQRLDLISGNDPRRHALRQIAKTCARFSAAAREEMQTLLSSTSYNAVVRERLNAELRDFQFRFDPAFRTENGNNFF